GHALGPLYPSPPHWFHGAAVAPGLPPLVVVALMVVMVLVAVVVVAAGLVVVVVEPPLPGSWKVEPMSPQRMLEKTTWVSGLLARMLAGLPSDALQGPWAPLSSQFMLPAASF